MSDHEDIKLSEKERNIIVKAMICAAEVPEIDMERLAKMLNMKLSSVTTRWSEIRRKIYASTPKGRTAVARRKRAHKKEETDDDEEETPAKKRKRAPARKKAADKETAKETADPAASEAEDEA